MTGAKFLKMFNKVGGGSAVYAHAKYPSPVSGGAECQSQTQLLLQIQPLETSESNLVSDNNHAS